MGMPFFSHMQSYYSGAVHTILAVIEYVEYWNYTPSEEKPHN